MKNWVLIPNGASREEFGSPRRGFRSAYGLQDGPVVLNVSNHFHIKGHELLFAAFDQAARRDARLVVIGDGPPAGRTCLRSCEAAAARSRGRIVLLQDVPRELVVSAFFEADLFAMSSEVECFPLVILEAMAAGTPWVSLPAGNVRELPGGMVAGSPGELALAMGLLLRNPELRSSLGAEGRRSWEKNFTWDRITGLYEDLYGRLLERSERRSLCTVI